MCAENRQSIVYRYLGYRTIASTRSPFISHNTALYKKVMTISDKCGVRLSTVNITMKLILIIFYNNLYDFPYLRNIPDTSFIFIIFNFKQNKLYKK